MPHRLEQSFHRLETSLREDHLTAWWLARESGPTKNPGNAWLRKNSLSQACCLAGNERRASSLMQKEGALIF